MQSTQTHPDYPILGVGMVAALRLFDKFSMEFGSGAV
jgi:anti-sigma regulatory factor (Ser/Thr protein kinase)